MLNDPQEDSKGSLIWKIAAGVLLILTLLFVALMIVGFVNSGSAQSDLDAERSRSEKLVEENAALNKSLAETQAGLNEWKTKAEILVKNVTDLQNITNTMNATIVEQQAQIASLKKTNMYLWIGGGSSAALMLGESVYLIYERSLMKSLRSQITSLQNQLTDSKKQLDAMTAKYQHLKTTFDETYSWVIDDDLLYYRIGHFTWDIVYDSATDGWSRDRFISAVKDKPMTTTIIMTDKDWAIAGFLKQPWKADGSFIKDSDAFMLAVNRGGDAVLPKDKPERAEKAAKVGGTGVMFVFGDDEVVVKEDKTGHAVAGRTYEQLEYKAPNEQFYAGQPDFNVTYVKVFSHTWMPNNSGRGGPGLMKRFQQPREGVLRLP